MLPPGSAACRRAFSFLASGDLRRKILTPSTSLTWAIIESEREASQVSGDRSGRRPRRRWGRPRRCRRTQVMPIAVASIDGSTTADSSVSEDPQRLLLLYGRCRERERCSVGERAGRQASGSGDRSGRRPRVNESGQDAIRQDWTWRGWLDEGRAPLGRWTSHRKIENMRYYEYRFS